MEEFALPDDITALNDEELDALLDGAVKAFDAKAGSSTVTSDDITQLRELATAVQDIRTEKAERIEAAQKAAAEIEALAATVRGDDPEQAAATEPAEPAAAEPAPEA
ncbi:cell wall protein, partial [Streptomyces sp. SID625]|nr:cell wall protein [Streptomyces sp. SID625]